jgi:two-component system sensor histidine kinase ChiS
MILVKMQKWFGLLLVLVVCATASFGQAVRVGTDLNSLQRLNGNWEFVWNELLTPSEFERAKGIKIVNVPHSWKEDGHPDFGIGTYRASILLPRHLTNHSISLPVVSSSAKVWLNGNLIDSLGICTSDLKKYRAKFGNLLIAVPSDTTSLELVVQIANFTYTFGGLGRAPRLGPTSILIHESNTRKGVENFFVGSLFAMFFYQIILFLLYQQGKPYLYLGLICLNVALRAMVTHGGSFLLLDLFPDVSMEFWKKLEFISVYSIVAIFPLYSFYLFPEQAFKKPIPVFIVCSVLLCLIVVFTPEPVYYQVLDICHLLLIAGFVYTFIVIARAWRAGNKEASIILFGVLASFPFILLEIAKNNQIIYFNVPFPFLVEMGVLVFLLFQVYLLAYHYSQAYKNLESVNINLEAKVQARTSELTKANQVREKLLSVVSHDIRGPLNSLRGVLDVYSQGGFSESEMKSITGQIEENMSNTSMLMDNILLWTSNQLKGVKVSYSTVEMHNLVDEHLKIFKTIAGNKDISLINSVEPFQVRSDKQILSLVLRNLIANSIKFSFEGGRIEIHAHQNNSDFVIQVKDNGKGIPTEDLGSLFQATISKEGTSHEKGTGLGLALCYDYLKHVNGEISVQSEINRGTSFTVRVPLVD